MGSSKNDEKISADDFVKFFTHFSVPCAIKEYIMEAGPLGRPQRPRSAKEVENATPVLYKRLLKAKSCAVAPSKTTVNWKKWILPGIAMKTFCRWPGALQSSYTRISCLMSPAKVISGPSLSFRCSTMFTKGHYQGHNKRPALP
jgi:hypothetical protein